MDGPYALPDLIPKTLVYVDARAKAQGVANHLRSVLGQSRAGKGMSQSELDGCIGVYSAIISPYNRDILMANFRRGDVRILVCTDACGMGLDIRDVERVAQFGITANLTISDLVQRIGRCARLDQIEGAAFVFVPERYVYQDR